MGKVIKVFRRDLRGRLRSRHARPSEGGQVYRPGRWNPCPGWTLSEGYGIFAFDPGARSPWLAAGPLEEAWECDAGEVWVPGGMPFVSRVHRSPERFAVGIMYAILVDLSRGIEAPHGAFVPGTVMTDRIRPTRLITRGRR